MALRMDDGSVVDPHNSEEEWDEKLDWNGNNHIGRSSGSQSARETLYLSRHGWFYLVTYYHGIGTSKGRKVNDREAVAWLVLNDHEVPESFSALEEEVIG